MIRIIYLGYYLKKLDFKLFSAFLNHTSQRIKKSKITILLDVISSSLKYNVSLLEYFQFRFFQKGNEERKTFAGTGYMYEYQLIMNPKDERFILDDKNTFNKIYKNFLVHESTSLEEALEDKSILTSILSNNAGKIVFKVSDGKCGAEVEIRETKDFDESSLIKYMQQNGYDLVEEYVIQHPAIMALSPSAVNTIRIFTQLNEKGNVEILGCRFRISINSHVDNLAAGNIAAPIDEKTGKVVGPGIYSDFRKKPEEVHPVTGTSIIGFQIPMWDEIMTLAKAAAKHQPQNRSIGWDIVLTEKGPGLIEGNHDWCKLVWQLPVGQGLKSELDKHKHKFKVK